MVTQLEIGDLVVGVVRKKIKNIYLRVYPNGDVRITAPMRASMESIRMFVRSKFAWIKEQQEYLRTRAQLVPKEIADPTEMYVWGKRYQLKIVEDSSIPGIELLDDTMIVRVRPGTTRIKRQALIDKWYSRQLELYIPGLLAKWERQMGVKATQVSIRKMKTRWGSCSPHSGRIRLNLDLAKKPFSCFEYVVVHELVHLLEPSHNHRFVAFMDKFLDNWRGSKRILNSAAHSEKATKPATKHATEPASEPATV